MAHEPSTVYLWLHSILSADTMLLSAGYQNVANRVYDEGEGPRNATYPLITFEYVGGVDAQGVGGVRILHNGLYQVTVVDNVRNSLRLRPIANRIDAVLHGRKNEALPGNVGWLGSCTREAVVPMPPDNIGDVQYRYAAQEYRVLAQMV